MALKLMHTWLQSYLSSGYVIVVCLICAQSKNKIDSVNLFTSTLIEHMKSIDLCCVMSQGTKTIFSNFNKTEIKLNAQQRMMQRK